MKKYLGIVKVNNTNAVKLMIFEKSKKDIFIFGYHRMEDNYCSWDAHYNDIADAFEMGEDYGISRNEWEEVERFDRTKSDDYFPS